MRSNRRSRRHGVFILNMLFTLGILGAFVLVADRVFRLSVVTVTKSTMQQEDALRLERALDALRADVWGATKVEPSADGSGVRITGLGNEGVEWRTQAEGGDLVRRAGEEERRWPGLGLAFRGEGGVLVVARKTGEVAVLRRAGGGS